MAKSLLGALFCVNQNYTAKNFVLDNQKMYEYCSKWKMQQ
jgi:hypothetical protein